ncbi:Hypothetical protein mma_0677 [Janthinobacterium sp. Marseille]|nr:hypothetical protein [Janthinobacterium sp. Marseille]ABR91837.1 Hypothetical protein mma_0677 [Janthinobacterium sp. Marseille]
MYRVLLVASLFLLCACSSTHDLKRDGANLFGGGFIDDQIGEGFYLIKGFSNDSIFVTRESAANTFEYRAKQLCPEGFAEVRTVANAYKSAIPGMPNPYPALQLIETPRNVITSKIGYVLCGNSPITLEQAKAIVVSRTE